MARLPLCRVLLMKDSRFPWLNLVPERDSVREIHELTPPDRAELIEEVALASEVLSRLFQPDKLNVGALGNVVLSTRQAPLLGPGERNAWRRSMCRLRFHVA